MFFISVFLRNVLIKGEVNQLFNAMSDTAHKLNEVTSDVYLKRYPVYIHNVNSFSFILNLFKYIIFKYTHDGFAFTIGLVP